MKFKARQSRAAKRRGDYVRSEGETQNFAAPLPGIFELSLINTLRKVG